MRSASVRRAAGLSMHHEFSYACCAEISKYIVKKCRYTYKSEYRPEWIDDAWRQRTETGGIAEIRSAFQ